MKIEKLQIGKKYFIDFNKLFSRLQAHLDTAPRHMLLRLAHGEFAVVKNARREHGVSAADGHALGQMVERADPAAGDDRDVQCG